MTLTGISLKMDSETDESSYTNSGRRLRIPNKVNNHLPQFGRNGLRRLGNHLSQSIKHENENNEKQNVRRSTRQRKFTYDNLNQTWLLASIPAEFSKFESIFSSEQRSPQDESCDAVQPRRSERNHNSQLRQLDLANDGLEYEDMYSRVKRKKKNCAYILLKTYFPRSSSEFPAGMSVVESQENSVGHGSKYSLRPKKPITERFQFPIKTTRPRRSTTATIFEATQHHPRPRERESFKSTAHRTHVYRRKRHAIHSSSNSSSEDEGHFEKRKVISMAKARSRCLPLNFIEDDLTKGVLRDRIKIGSSLADIDPMSIDKTVSFDHVGGLDKHIRSLKEMILFPLMYPEVFQRFKISRPLSIVLWIARYGKTLVARALANECSTGDKRVAFFMRKGADCLSKWVGESERQFRLLFDQAYSMRPSIIFFDEIDGLAPVRSTRQDQIHSSIVSTLLALMDGLDNRVYVRELAACTTGYCGADLKALCSEAAFVALRRRYPQIYASRKVALGCRNNSGTIF
ncbi:ATPase family AAA domain-containing protein 2B [Caerostris extrusa]|uniref:ATPase family AAA domain-containing protein 2B n=1 Tax=Caerostris extrusa TaxID=172846 RepID=A0AAV4QAU7_CAEEX|nr:ATPase family AAA domain-containing protein 2B [Caerostris extrusa]